jgi:hypothetical protein
VDIIACAHRHTLSLNQCLVLFQPSTPHFPIPSSVQCLLPWKQVRMLGCSAPSFLTQRSSHSSLLLSDKCGNNNKENFNSPSTDKNIQICLFLSFFCLYFCFSPFLPLSFSHPYSFFLFIIYNSRPLCTN